MRTGKLRQSLLVAICLCLTLGIPAAASASGLYGRDGYGKCAYERDCPTTSVTPPTTTTTTSTGTKPKPTTPSSPTTTKPVQPGQLSPQYPETVPQKVLSSRERLPSILAFVFPWLLFILLGLTLARLSYMAWQEKRLKEALDKQIRQEKELSDEKSSFLNLSSHYLRTPVTAISNGVELIASLAPNQPGINQTKDLAHQIAANTNNLLQSATTRISAAVIPSAAPTVYQPLGTAQPLAAGFVKVASLPFITVALLGCLVVIGLADVIVNRADIYDVQFVDLLIQLALLLLVGVMLFSTLHSYQRRKLLREQAEQLLNNQRALDASRDELIKGSLESLRTPLLMLKSQLQPLAAANPKAARPALDGVGRLEALLQKFVILTSLESGSMSTKKQVFEASSLVSQTANRYTTVLNQKGLSLENTIRNMQANTDPLLLTFVVDSLLSNAIKYAPEKSRISINGQKHGDHLRIEVKDDGPGIPQDKLNELMQPFSRVEDTTANFNTEGAGISLYLDKLILKYLGGNLRLSPGLTGGTVASIELSAV